MANLEDSLTAEGPKIIDLGMGYSLQVYYAWGGDSKGKQFRLLLPTTGRQERKLFVDLQLNFDITNHK